MFLKYLFMNNLKLCVGVVYLASAMYASADGRPLLGDAINPYSHSQDLILLAQTTEKIKSNVPTTNPDKATACSVAKMQLKLQQCANGKIDLDMVDCNCNYNGSIWMCSASGKCEWDY